MKGIIVCGTRDNTLSRKLLQECDTTLFKAVKGGSANEEACKHAHEIFIS